MMQSLQVPRFLLFSRWTLVSAFGIALAVAAFYFGLWSFLAPLHPGVLGAVSVLLTLWLLFALSPKITVQLMQLVDITLPRGDSGVPFVGMMVRGVIVLVGPGVIYLCLMVLREETTRAADIAAASALGLLLGCLTWRSLELLRIMWRHYPEDEVRKGLLDTGVYNDEAIGKLERAVAEIRNEGSLDAKRIRLRRLAATDRVLRNKNYDPHQIQEGTAGSATLAGLDRQEQVVSARRKLKRADLDGDLEDERILAGIAELKARQRHFDSQFQRHGARPGASKKEVLSAEAGEELGWEEAGEWYFSKKRKQYEEQGLEPEEIERRMSRLEAKITEIIARKLSE